MKPAFKGIIILVYGKSLNKVTNACTHASQHCPHVRFAADRQSGGWGETTGSPSWYMRSSTRVGDSWYVGGPEKGSVVWTDRNPEGPTPQVLGRTVLARGCEVHLAIECEVCKMPDLRNHKASSSLYGLRRRKSFPPPREREVVQK